MASIGERLREERLRSGLTIEHVAERTRINASFLEAIETERFEQLPGAFFARSFVRQYARALGLSGDEFEAELKELGGGEPPPAAEARPEFKPDVSDEPWRPARAPSRLAGNQALGALIAFLLILAACSGIYVLWERSRGHEEPLAAAPARRNVVPRTDAAKPEPPIPQPEPPAAAPNTLQSPASAPPASAEPAAPAAQPAAPVRVEIEAKTDVWLRVRGDGKLLFEGFLKPQQNRTFEGQQAVTVRIGDPGRVRFVLNGTPAEPIEAGQPRTIVFTPGTFRVLTPPPASTAAPDVL